MPPPRKRPHPRSLDALFGPAKPRVAPTRRCPKGHKLHGKAKADDCYECRQVEARLARAQEGAREKAAYREASGPVPHVLRILTLDTQKVTAYAIPPALAAQKKRADLKRRRGRRRAAGI